MSPREIAHRFSYCPPHLAGSTVFHEHGVECDHATKAVEFAIAQERARCLTIAQEMRCCAYTPDDGVAMLPKLVMDDLDEWVEEVKTGKEP